MKKISKFRFITTVLLMTLLLFIGVANAVGNIDIRQLKEAQQLDKINHAGKNVFMNFRKSIIEESFIKKLESVSKIESFINDIAVSGLSLYNVPRLSKSLANKIKQFVVLGNITPAKGDELVRKLKGMQHSNLKRDRVYLCGECGEDCDLAKFITANIGESYETATISANDSTNKTFLKSQDAIVQNDYANMVQSFDVCLAEINRLITKMPDVKSCKCDNEECYFTYSALYLEYLFLKKYMTIQKGYFLLKNGRYSEAEAYFKSQTSTPAVAVSKISLAAEKKAMIKWNEEVIRITLTYFIGRCLYEQGQYSEALKYFNDSTILKIPQPPTLLYGSYDTITMYDRYPYSGLYSDFSIYDDTAERGKQTGKSFFWVWQGYYFSGMANYKLGNNKYALAFLKAYIASPDKEFENESKKLIAELETVPMSSSLIFSGNQFPEVEPVYVNIKDDQTNVYKDVYYGTIGISNYPESLAEVKIMLECETQAKDLEDNSEFFKANGVKDRRYLDDNDREKGFGFYDGKEYKQKIEVKLTKQNPQAAFGFRCTSYCGDTFNIKATCKVNGVDASAVKKLQTWRQYELRLYTMKNDKRKFSTTVTGSVETFRKCCVLLIPNEEVYIPYHAFIGTDCTISLPDEMPLPAYVLNELKDVKIKFKKQNEYINVIGADKLTGLDGSKKIEIAGLSTPLIANDTETFYSIILANGESNQKNKPINHELGHCFDLKHETIECYMKEGYVNKLDFCENCKIIIRNNSIMVRKDKK